MYTNKKNTPDDLPVSVPSDDFYVPTVHRTERHIRCTGRLDWPAHRACGTGDPPGMPSGHVYKLYAISLSIPYRHRPAF